MASNNIKSVGKNIGVKVLPKTFCKSIGIGTNNTFSTKYWYCYWQQFLHISLTSLEWINHHHYIDENSHVLGV